MHVTMPPKHHYSGTAKRPFDVAPVVSGPFRHPQASILWLLEEGGAEHPQGAKAVLSTHPHQSIHFLHM